MKMTDEAKIKMKYAIAAAVELMKLTLQTLVALPASYYAYMGFKSMGWFTTYTATLEHFYLAAAYLLGLLWLEILVLGIGFAVITVIALTKE